MNFKTAHSQKKRYHHPSTKGQSMTRPEYRRECDIHTIIRRGIPQITNPLIFSDNFQIGDKIDTYLKVQHAAEQFNSLPAETRKVFDNQPGKLIEAIESSNIGLLKLANLLPEPPAPPASITPAATPPTA